MLNLNTIEILKGNQVGNLHQTEEAHSNQYIESKIQQVVETADTEDNMQFV